MPLKIKLRDGFQQATVTIKADGQEVYRKSGVQTDLSISFADAVELPVTRPVVQLEVAIQGGPQARLQVRADETPFVDVWVLDGRMDLRASREDTPML